MVYIFNYPRKLIISDGRSTPAAACPAGAPSLPALSYTIVLSRSCEALSYHVLSIENDRGLHLVHRLATVTGLDTAVVGRQYNHRIIHDTRLTNGVHHLRQATVQMIHHGEILRGLNPLPCPVPSG